MGRAAEIPSPASALQSTPPDFPDIVHVASGCHVSTLAYIARFLAAVPCEHAVPLIVSLENRDGSRKPHTVALLTWQGRWWCRDEYYGVFSLQRAVAAHPRPEQLATWAGARLERQARERWRSADAPRPRLLRSDLPAAAGERDLELAAALLPFPTRRFEVRCGTETFSVLLFRPAANEIAVYEPRHGTCLGVGPISNDARAVEIVATRLGYRVLAVHPSGVAADALAPL